MLLRQVCFCVKVSAEVENVAHCAAALFSSLSRAISVRYAQGKNPIQVRILDGKITHSTKVNKAENEVSGDQIFGLY